MLNGPVSQWIALTTMMYMLSRCGADPGFCRSSSGSLLYEADAVGNVLSGWTIQRRSIIGASHSFIGKIFEDFGIEISA